MRIQGLWPIAAVVGALAATSGHGAVVAESLPYVATPDWTDAEFPDTTMTNSGGETTLSTVNGQGIWFGWGQGYADPQPSWDLGSNTTGNRLAITARFSAGSRDWNSYLGDGSFFADLEFLPTDCNYTVMACYDAPAFSGISLLFADSGIPAGYTRQYVDLDLTIDHNFGFLLKNGLVSYTIDGATYAGAAVNSGSRILVIGDGSGSSPTGTGSMTISAVSFDNAPNGDVSLSVPEPANWALMVAGFGLVGRSLRAGRRTANA